MGKQFKWIKICVKCGSISSQKNNDRYLLYSKYFSPILLFCRFRIAAFRNLWWISSQHAKQVKLNTLSSPLQMVCVQFLQPTDFVSPFLVVPEPIHRAYWLLITLCPTTNVLEINQGTGLRAGGTSQDAPLPLCEASTTHGISNFIFKHAIFSASSRYLLLFNFYLNRLLN